MTMANRIIVDSGPLVALLSPRDRAHEWCLSQMETFEEPLVTCDAVLSEAFFLLKRHADRGSEELMEMIRRGLVRSMFSFSEKEDRILSIMKKYAKLPTSFADLCLVAMAEQFKNAKVWTLDSDFRIYRKIDRRLIPLISPY